MDASMYLFEMEPFTKKGRQRRTPSMPVEVRMALARLKKTMDAIPPAERAARRRRWEQLQRSLRSR